MERDQPMTKERNSLSVFNDLGHCGYYIDIYCRVSYIMLYMCIVHFISLIVIGRSRG